MNQKSTETPNPNDILEKEGLFEYHRYLVEGMRTNGVGKIISFDILDNEHNRNVLENEEGRMRMTNKDALMVDYISQLIDGFEDKRFGMSALLRMVIKIGCDHNHDDCRNCPLTSYLCRQMHTQSNLLLENNEEDSL